MDLFSGIVFVLLFIWFCVEIDIEFYGYNRQIGNIKSAHIGLNPVIIGIVYYYIAI